MQATRRRASTAGVIALVLLSPGCSDSGGAAYVSERVDKLTVDRPTAWANPVTVEQPWTKGFRLAAGSVEQIQLSGDFGEFVSASQGMGSLIGQAQIGIKGFTVVETRDVKIKGATTGQAVRYTITDTSGSQLSGEWVVAAHWPYPQSVAVSILEPQFDPELERRVLESMELRPVLQ